MVSIFCYFCLRSKHNSKWQEAADLNIYGLKKTIQSKKVTYDFDRLMEGATKLKCSKFGTEIINNM